MSARIVILVAFLAAVPPAEAQKIYWSGGGMIQRADPDGSNIELLVQTGFSHLGGGIALDLRAGKMYWVGWEPLWPGKVQRANLDGSNVEDLVTIGVDGPKAIALDVPHGKMYWTDPPEDAILRADLDGSNVETLVTSGLASPAGIALDRRAGRMYWCDPGTGKIQRASLDGSNVEDLVTSGLNGPSSIALDAARAKMYWTEGSIVYPPGKIRRANLDGSNVEDLITTPLIFPEGIALDLNAGLMYWTDFMGQEIYRAKLDGSNAEEVFTTPDNPLWLALDWAPLSPWPIPAVSEWGLLIAGLLFLVAGTVCLRRRGRSVACCLALAFSSAGTAQAANDPPTHVVRIPGEASPDVAALGLTPLLNLDYGTFVWLELSGADFAVLQSSALWYEERPDPYSLHLGGRTFDPLEGVPPLPPGWDTVAADGAERCICVAGSVW